MQVTAQARGIDWVTKTRKPELDVNSRHAATNPAFYPPNGTNHPMKKNTLPFAAAAAGLLLALAGCSKHDVVLPSIASIAVANPDFQMLEDAAIRGDVAVLLSNKAPDGGDYTVFAPTNAAFARLGLNTAADLGALDRGFLRTTLFYHVTGGRVAGADLAAGSSTPSAVGATITRRIIVRGADKYVNGSKILATDVQAANGLVHPIDKVLLTGGGNIVQTAIAVAEGKVFVQPELTLLVAAVVRSGLVTTLSDPTASFTIFAPTDAAFRAFGAAAGIPLNTTTEVGNADPATLRAVLLNHALGGGKFTPELNPGSSAITTTAAGGLSLTIGGFEGGVETVKGPNNATPATMAIPDVHCTNGVVHIINKVLN